MPLAPIVDLMSSESDLHSTARACLARNEQRLTRVRSDLLDVFEAAGEPLSVRDVIERLAADEPQSSVYRNISVFCDAGVLRRLNFDEGFVRYELDHGITSDHHHHLVCGSCSRVVDLDAAALTAVEAALAEAEAAVERTLGFRVLDHQLDLRGRCASCRGRS